MTDYRITYTETTELELSSDDLKESFSDEWADNLLSGGSDEEFVQSLIDEYGVSYLKELDIVGSLRDDEYSLEVEIL